MKVGTRAGKEALFKKLQPGPGLPTEQVVANQRARLCGAMFELVAEHGFRHVTVRKLTALAGVSSRAFYDCFANTEECFGATYSRVVDDLLARVVKAPHRREETIRARSRALLGALAEDPGAARLVLVESQFAGSAARRQWSGSVSAFEELVREGFAIEPDPVAPPPRVVKAVAGAAIWVARSRLQDRSTDLGRVADEFTVWLSALRDRRIERLPVSPRVGPPSDARRGSTRRERIVEDRGFLLTAAAKLGVAEGYGNLTVPRIRREAGVSRRSFDANFRDVADCFLEAVESRTTAAVKRAEADARRAGSWERAMVRVVVSLCGGVARDPGFARLAFLEILAPGPEGLAKSDQIIGYWAKRFLEAAPAENRPSPLIVELSVAGAWSMARCEVLSGRGHCMREAIAEMSFVLLAPLIGGGASAAAIRAEFAASVPNR
jgi:AcrR family transcriptional regulator